MKIIKRLKKTKKKYKDKFFDFQDENNRMRVFTYTIDGSKIKEKEAIKKQEKLYEELNKIKTLVSRATPVLLTGQEGTFIACIFLETKFSFYRQNFDFFDFCKYSIIHLTSSFS